MAEAAETHGHGGDSDPHFAFVTADNATFEHFPDARQAAMAIGGVHCNHCGDANILISSFGDRRHMQMVLGPDEARDVATKIMEHLDRLGAKPVVS